MPLSTHLIPWLSQIYSPKTKSSTTGQESQWKATVGATVKARVELAECQVNLLVSLETRGLRKARNALTIAINANNALSGMKRLDSTKKRLQIIWTVWRDQVFLTLMFKCLRLGLGQFPPQVRILDLQTSCLKRAPIFFLVLPITNWRTPSTYTSWNRTRTQWHFRSHVSPFRDTHQIPTINSMVETALIQE
jgi:hypothetical protein